MYNSFYLAWQYLKFHKFRTILLILSIIIVTSLPININLVIKRSEKNLLRRAKSTPLILGAKSGNIDLTINTLYFTSKSMETLKMLELKRLNNTQGALAIPIFNQFKAQQYPVIGTNLDYLSFRNLSIEKGEKFDNIGEAVIGSEVAKNLDLKIGDTLISKVNNPFNFKNANSLKIKVIGILESSQSADDFGVFVSLKTTWIIAGFGHFHYDLENSHNTDYNHPSTLSQNYTEITPNNIKYFHFHEDELNLPLTAIIIVPNDQKSETLLRGYYQNKDLTTQIIKPTQVIEDLFLKIFKVQKLLNILLLIIIFTTVMTTLLIFHLSLRLRERELQTNYRLGCSRLKNVQIILAEITIVLIISCVSVTLITITVNSIDIQKTKLVIPL